MTRGLRHVALAAAVVSVLLASVAVPAFAGDTGLKEGDKTAAFQVNDVTGPNKGKQLCYV